MWRVVLWGLFMLFIRYVYLGGFYNDKAYVLNQLAISIVAQTMLLYYVFGNYVFPRTLYQRRPFLLLLYLLISHIIVYESNYILFSYLGKVSSESRVARDWAQFQAAGVSGFVSNITVSFYSFFWSFPFAIMFLTARAIRHTLALRTRNFQLEREKLNLELDFLKAQVNPHFLFNTLNSIYADVFETNEKAADLVLRLSELMRYNLYETDRPKIALDKELAYIQNYLNLERNRLAGQNVMISYSQKGDPTGYQIAPLLLIAFVENAFKHGVKGAVKPAYVQIQAEISPGKLTFRVENSVTVRRTVEEPVYRSGGIGLGNVRRRLDALYSGRYELVVTPNPDRYVVTLTIQVEPL